MKRIKLLGATCVLCCTCIAGLMQAYDEKTSTRVDNAIIKDPEVHFKKDAELGKNKKDAANKKKSFSFKFTDESLIDVINIVAEKKHVNVALPAGANAITSKVTISVEEKMTIDEAWDFLIQVLDIAGYSVVPSSGIYQIVRTTEAVTREALPIYIGVPWDQIPDSGQRIRCVFYLSNIKVPSNEPPEADNELYTVISKLLPNGQTGTQVPTSPRLAFDPVTNAVIIADRATVIRSIMEIVSALDTTGFKEKIEMLPLYNTVASEVKQIFDEIYKPTQSTSPYRLDARKPVSEATYFSKFVRILPYGRLNMLIVLGREQAVDRVTDFVRKYIDVPQDTGESVFHTYSLQYLDAADFSQILQNIVNSASTGGTGQSRAEGAAAAQGGTERMFEGVIITHDKVVEQPQGAGTEEKAKAIYFGGNRLIVAARRDDWLRIKKLCEELDTPQPQVIIEVLIADLTDSDNRAIGSMLRNPLRIPLVGDIQAQSAQLARGILVNDLNLNAGQSPATVGLDNQNHNNDTDILKDAYNASGDELTTDDGALTNQSIASQATAGTTVISLIDPCTQKVWSLLEIKNLLESRKVLTNPHIVAVNNKQTQLVIGQSRLLEDAAVGNQGGNATVPRKSIEANLTINLKPRISLSPDGDPANDTVQLGIVVTIDQFTEANFTSQSATEGNRFIRKVETSAHVRNREVIPLGGLLSRTSTQSETDTPILSRIPIIGYFFKNRGGTAADTNITVFLCPTVVRPRLRRGGVDRYTRDYVKLTKKYAQEGLLFDSLKDPVTRWFFNTESDVVDTVNDFLSDDEFKREKEVRILSKRSRARAEARSERTAKDLEYQEMNAGDDDVRIMQGDSYDTDDEEEQKLAMHSGVIGNERLQSKLLEVASSVKTTQVAFQEDKEIKKMAVDNASLEREVLKSQVLEQVCPLKTTQVAVQDILSPLEKEERLKALIRNEENPLQEYLPA